jgi:hypothetical protein
MMKPSKSGEEFGQSFEEGTSLDASFPLHNRSQSPLTQPLPTVSSSWPEIIGKGQQGDHQK